MGCHVWQSLASGTELVRVNVWSSDGATSEDVVARFVDAQQNYEAAMLRGDPELPENPHRLLQAVRKLRYEPSEAAQRRFEIENYLRADVRVTHAKSLADALRPGWLLQKSRRGR